MTTASDDIKQRILQAARDDPRVAGCIEYGSGSEGRGDEWSDLDMALFLHDGELAGFEKDWKTWAAQFGTPLLAYISGVGHPWLIYDTGDLPLRVDLAFLPVTDMDDIPGWPSAPASVASMVLLDRTDGKLSAAVGQIVGQSLAPADLQRTFEQSCGDFWYYLLRTYSKLMRGQFWAVRYDHNFIITGNLLALLRIEAGALGRWRGSSAAVGIERDIPARRLEQLDTCIPGRSNDDLKPVMLHSALLGREVCAEIARARGWDWPAALAERVLAVLRD
jgi:hypothetical protein